MSACRSCGAEIFWAETAGGKRMPVDADPVPDGNVIVEDRPGDGLRATVLEPGALMLDDPGLPRYVSHFATCPNASQHRHPSPHHHRRTP